MYLELVVTIIFMTISLVAGLTQGLIADRMSKYFDFEFDPSYLFLSVIYVFIGGIMTIIGVLTTPALNLRSYSWDVFREPINPVIEHSTLLEIVLYNIIIIGTFWILYFGFFKRLIGKTNFDKMEKLGTDIPLVTRIFSGGLFEEIVFRWGFLSGIWYLASIWLSLSLNYGFWIANFVSAFVFGLVHIPQSIVFSQLLDIDKIKILLFSSMSINVLIGLSWGYLFLHFSIEAAMFSHILIHLLWHLKLLIFEEIPRV